MLVLQSFRTKKMVDFVSNCEAGQMPVAFWATHDLLASVDEERLIGSVATVSLQKGDRGGCTAYGDGEELEAERVGY